MDTTVRDRASVVNEYVGKARDNNGDKLDPVP